MPLISPDSSIFLDTIKAFDKDDLSMDEIDDIDEALVQSGVPREKLPGIPIESDHFKKILNYSGASVENASKTIASVMQNGKYENSKLRAAELVLDLHGIRDKDGKTLKTPIFNFIIKDSAVNINAIFCPIRSEDPVLAEQGTQIIDSPAILDELD